MKRTYRIAIDTECTGLDLRHGAKPYLVTITNNRGQTNWWEWYVDPETREPIVKPSDLVEIQAEIDRADEIIFQNYKYDLLALSTIMPDIVDNWDWSKTHELLLSAHCLCSNQRKDLTTQALIYLYTDITEYEENVKEATKEAIKIARREFKDWNLAKAGRSDMPSVKGNAWKGDMWLPRLLAKSLDYPSDHNWWSVTASYANADSAATLLLRDQHVKLLKETGRTVFYEYRRKLMKIVFDMEQVGVSISGERALEQRKQFTKQSTKYEKNCIKAASKVGQGIEKLPVNGASNDLKRVIFHDFKLKPIKVTAKGNPSLDKVALRTWHETLDPSTPAHSFIDNLIKYRKKKTGLSFLASYEKFWIPTGVYNDKGEQLWYRLYPSLNITGTDTLRWSSSNPNEQQISKQEESNLRHSFGPLPGREWFSLDARNIELRIPAYEADERDMIGLFEDPNSPPYFGSNHLLNFHTIYPDLWEKAAKEVGADQAGLHCKKIYAGSWYQWCKNGGFALQYGAGEATADAAFHRTGCYNLLKQKFAKIHGPDGLNERCIKFANEHGYVETIPDKLVNPDHGYPLYCARTTWGGVKPTIPLNYRTQGTAMWWMMVAMIEVDKYLQQINKGIRNPLDRYYMIMQVHDELVFDFPAKKSMGNLPKVRKISSIMERVGDRIGVPTPVGIEYHPETWSKGIAL